MTEKVEKEDWISKQRAFLLIFVASFVAGFLKEALEISYNIALVVCYTVGFLLIYWISPKPEISFRQWALRGLEISILVAAAIWLLPELLSRLIWRPLAVALPIFLVFISIPFLPSLSSLKKKAPFWQWLLMALFFAILMGGVEYAVNGRG